MQNNVTLSKKSGKGMIHGVISELTTFFTVQPGHEEAMRAAVERVNQMLREMGPEVHRKMGLREWRMVLFDNGKRLMLATSFETDWDPYVDDAIVTFSPASFSDWLQHTVEAGLQAERGQVAKAERLFSEGRRCYTGISPFAGGRLPGLRHRFP